MTEGEFDGHARLFRVGVDYDLHNGAFVFGGFIVDWDGPNRGMQLLDHNTAGDSEIRNIVFRGRHSLGCEGALRLNPQTPDSTCLLQNIDMRAGGQHYTDTINTRSERDGESWATSGLTAHPDKAGTLHVDRVYCGGWPDNGLYVKGGPGQTIVTHSIAANSKIANIRINGKGSLIDRCTVIINREISEHFDGQVGIRLDDGTPTLRRTRVEISSPIPTYAIFSRQVEEAWIHNVDVALGVDCVGIMCSELAGPTHITNVRFRTPTTGGGRLILGSPARPSDVTDDGVTIH
ncbi:hypothetical protein [Halegenticoccus tardaugens]|uniref:hypothetical protein n=1 Tax=Halegenticoccus tardaugens TaxID=2071624 RepID=UPI00100AD79F|nr:hypothetical protein [Halegenticoccus tardaugens]